MRPKPPIPVDDLGEEVQRLGDVLVEGSDLTVALIGATFLEECLRSLLSSRFKVGGTATSLLHPGRGPLGTFVARMDLAYCLGLIDKSTVAALRTIAEIRNTFAHSYVEGHFEQDDVGALCDKLDYAYDFIERRVREKEREGTRKTMDKFFTNRRNRFTYTVMLVGQTLMLAAAGRPALSDESGG